MGTGYVPCQICYKPECFKCNNTEYEECRICRGNVNGCPGYISKCRPTLYVGDTIYNRFKNS